jgi:hypothetical protein
MSQKSSVPQAVSFVSQVLKRDTLDKDAPRSRPVQRIGSIMSYALLGGLHHHYVRV